MAHRFAERPEVIEALASALQASEHKHPEWAMFAKHGYHNGLTVHQTARLMEISERTARRYLEQARIVLHAEFVQQLAAWGHDLAG